MLFWLNCWILFAYKSSFFLFVKVITFFQFLRLLTSFKSFQIVQLALCRNLKARSVEKKIVLNVYGKTIFNAKQHCQKRKFFTS